MEWKELERINKGLQTIDVKGKGYVEVNKRVMAFRELEPNGTITTEIVSHEDLGEKGKVVTMKATVLNGNGKVLGTGLAYEKETSSFINKTSYIENCETSAVGRALGFCGIGVDTSIASAEEVMNAIKQEEDQKAKPKLDRKNNEPSATGITPGGVDYITQLCIETGTDPAKVLSGYKVNSFYELTKAQYDQATKELERRLEDNQALADAAQERLINGDM